MIMILQSTSNIKVTMHVFPCWDSCLLFYESTGIIGWGYSPNHMACMIHHIKRITIPNESLPMAMHLLTLFTFDDSNELELLASLRLNCQHLWVQSHIYMQVYYLLDEVTKTSGKTSRWQHWLVPLQVRLVDDITDWCHFR